jgi:MtrB/PioB family decaheme-associated outer membrane protein
MRTSTPLWLLGALGALSLTVGSGALAADPSTWTCETCPFESGTSATVDAGVGVVSDKSTKFADFTGLDRKGGFAVLGGSARYRGKDGMFGNFSASDLGLDTRSLAADGGQEGRYALRLAYAEIPHWLSDGAATPFLGIGSAVLTLPAGFPAPTTADMPLAATLQPVDIGFKRKRLDLGATLDGPPEWSYRVDLRHDVRDGTQRAAGSFFSTTSQLVAPLDQTTDQLEASVSYAGPRLHASLAYHASTFRNGNDALTWQNPFSAGIIGATSGQLALAPDNQFHQVIGNIGYQITPAVQASAEVAVGRMTQDASFLAATLNPGLVVPALPAQSLQASADTLDASLRLSAKLGERLKLSGSLTRNERDNKTASLAYPSVSTDMFVGANPRSNLPYSFTRDRAKLAADWRGPGSLKLAAGIDDDTVHRTNQEVDRTHETTAWARGSIRTWKNIGITLKAARSERDNSGYNVVAAVQPPENPLLRKFNLADRRRDSAGLRADATIGEGISVGINLDLADDNYRHSLIGLTRARSASLGGDLAAAIGETTQARLFAQSERIRSRQVGSQAFGAPDWTGRTEDSVDVVGVGVTHSALKGKLELSGDLVWSRSRSESRVDTGASASEFPPAKTAMDSLKLAATYQLSDTMSVVCRYWYEHYDARDWHLDGVLPATVPNLLAFGEQAPRYNVHVVQVALRYRWK